MPLSDKAPEGRKKKGPACSVSTMLDGMTEDDQQTALSWFDDDLYSHNAIFERLEEEGFVCSLTQLKRHRRKVCACYATS
jgi:hypothetical protein